MNFTQFYSRLGISFDLYSGESHVSHDTMLKIEQDLKEKEIYKEDDGVWVVDTIDSGAKPGAPPVKIRNRGGSTTYTLRELATFLDQEETRMFDKMIYVVGNDHTHHFQQVFKIIRLLGR